MDELLKYTLPALLAPGNLPYIASQVSCEVILLTEEHLFERVSCAPCVERMRELCPVRLVTLDDLIAAPDNKYGMALTYALHRGFSDLGPAMADCWLIFLNADFILADGSLKSLLPHLQRGSHIVAAPSYCVAKSDALPLLDEALDKPASVLSVQPRDMARIALRHRHNTIRGKTVNQTAFHIHYMEQFYWHVDSNTLLGHQMPVAIVGLRPQRYLAEPTAYWDHGLIREFCPTAEIKLLGDSDEFLMIELRDKDVAKEQFAAGWPTARELGERMISWVTPYQRDFALLPLTLHSEELPPSTTEARDRLRAFVEEVISFVPARLPSHIDHPQWNYHWPAFTQARHQYLSRRLGNQTRTTPPPDSFSEIDKCWWRLDGLQKALAQRNVLIEMMNRQVQVLSEGIERELARQDTENNMRLLEQVSSLQIDGPSKISEPYPSKVLGRSPDQESSQIAALEAALSRFDAAQAAVQAEAERRREKLSAAVGAVRQYYMKRVHELESQLEEPIAALKAEYDRQVAKRVSTAATPYVRTRVGPDTSAPAAAAGLKGLAARAYRKALGKWPNVTILSPLWAPIEPLHNAVRKAIAAGAEDVLFVGNRTGLANGIASLPGLHAWVSVDGLTSGNFPKAFDKPPQFDLCICELDLAEAMRFDEIVACARPSIREGGTILGFWLNAGPQPATPQQLDFSRTGARITYAGSGESARVVAAHAAVFSRGGLPRVLFGLRVAAGLALLTPRSLFANLAHKEVQATPPPRCTSVTLSVHIPWFEGDDGTLEFAKSAGVYVTGVEPPTLPERRVDSTVANPPGTAVILTFGQSNAANEGAGAYVPRQKVHVFNIFDMNYYVAADPLPGASGFGGSVWGRLGDRLIEAGVHKSVLFVPIAFGASYIKDWAPGGPCHRRLQLALRRLRSAGIKVDRLCWHQGEADANHTDMAAQEYKSQFLRMVRAIRSIGVDAPIHIAVTSLCENAAHPYENREQIRLAQQQLVSVRDGLLPGPDTDRFDGEHRRDGCHFSESGLDLCAQAWLESLTSEPAAGQ